MRREAIVGLALGIVAAALVLVGSGGMVWQSAASAAFIVAAVSFVAWGTGRWRMLGAGSVIVGLAIAPSSTEGALALGVVLAALFGLGVALWGIPPGAWLSITLFVALGLAVAVLPGLLAPRLVGLDAAPFLLLVAGFVGAPCAVVAFVKRERHSELSG